MKKYEKVWYEVAEKKNFSNRTTLATLIEAKDFLKSLPDGKFMVTRTRQVRVYDDDGNFISDKQETRKIDI